ncbi:hypothetical protein T03_7947 [Trichinella britovi]|uniref:Uncharacterized protein n=1 Tax=Trichinella britovi TaxID=45882 RepID=A0A0V1CBX0_TRIBR|nr:hypothetical protein T03_7947 [Trichinella britovi]
MNDENTDKLTAFLDSSVALKMLSNDILSRHTLQLCPVNKRAAILFSVYKGGFTRSHFSLIGLCPRYFIGPSNLCRIGFHFIGP